MKKDNAVSEVVSIMIMLTITIVLVSVVALTATSTFGETEKPLSAEITAVSVSGDDVIFELISGEPVALSDIRVVLGIREDSTKSVSIPGTALTPLVSGDTIFLGDRFTLNGVAEETSVKFGGMTVQKDEHLTYRFYDTTDRPFSSGEIRITT
ncbi:type IV pilin N-terminal domain-containing protein [Methanocorpusculaceae archaeon]|nr:type IV pilin N-terminal domain-containing protein [Methanocorpusculaceae archaeon]